jgi:hypothetical protein
MDKNYRYRVPGTVPVKAQNLNSHIRTKYTGESVVSLTLSPLFPANDEENRRIFQRVGLSKTTSPKSIGFLLWHYNDECV